MMKTLVEKTKKILAVVVGLFITSSSVDKVYAATDTEEVATTVNNARKNLMQGQKFKELKDTELYLDDMSSPKMWPNWGNWGNWGNWNNWNNWAKWSKWDKWSNWNDFSNWGNY